MRMLCEVELENALSLLKTRLNRRGADEKLDETLKYRLNATAEELKKTGITLTDSADDMMLLVDMTAWSYGNRDKNTGMPDWLKQRRRERWLQEQRGTTA